jgi:superfamily II DNA helicase RecQ
MAFIFYKIRVNDDGGAAAELNEFLASHRILSVRTEWLAAGDESYWAFCIDYADGQAREETTKTAFRDRVDYKKLLDPEQFALYAQLRDLRKDLASKEGVPVFTLFTNEQLAEMVKAGCRTIAELQEIGGVGEARSGKYGAAFLEILNRSVGGDS